MIIITTTKKIYWPQYSIITCAIQQPSTPTPQLSIQLQQSAQGTANSSCVNSRANVSVVPPAESFDVNTDSISFSFVLPKGNFCI